MMNQKNHLSSLLLLGYYLIINRNSKLHNRCGGIWINVIVSFFPPLGFHQEDNSFNKCKNVIIPFFVEDLKELVITICSYGCTTYSIRTE